MQQQKNRVEVKENNCIFVCFEQNKMLIIPLNPDSVPLLLHNSKFAYFRSSCFELDQTIFVLHRIFSFDHFEMLDATSWRFFIKFHFTSTLHSYDFVPARRISFSVDVLIPRNGKFHSYGHALPSQKI